MKKVNVLGTEYTVVESNESTDPALIDRDGYCDTSVKLCVIDELNITSPAAKKDLPGYKKVVTRHEIIHAFLYESGLANNSEWAEIEEMVDWIALQFPKMLKAFKEADCL